MSLQCDKKLLSSFYRYCFFDYLQIPVTDTISLIFAKEENVVTIASLTKTRGSPHAK